MIHKLIWIDQSQENFKDDLNTIKQIALNKGYKMQTINKIFQKYLERPAINQLFP